MCISKILNIPDLQLSSTEEHFVIAAAACHRSF